MLYTEFEKLKGFNNVDYIEFYIQYEYLDLNEFAIILRRLNTLFNKVFFIEDNYMKYPNIKEENIQKPRLILEEINTGNSIKFKLSIKGIINLKVKITLNDILKLLIFASLTLTNHNKHNEESKLGKDLKIQIIQELEKEFQLNNYKRAINFNKYILNNPNFLIVKINDIPIKEQK